MKRYFWNRLGDTEHGFVMRVFDYKNADEVLAVVEDERRAELITNALNAMEETDPVDTVAIEQALRTEIEDEYENHIDPATFQCEAEGVCERCALVQRSDNLDQLFKP